MTYLQIVNKVLLRLRENEVSSVSQNSYSRLIGELVNETKREVEDAWSWVRLRTTIQVVTEEGTFRYTLTGAGDRFTLLHSASGRPSVFNYTDAASLLQIPGWKMTSMHNGGTAASSAPMYFDFNGGTDGDPNVDFWPIHDAAYAVNFDLVIPQDSLVNDSDELVVPSWPVITGAYAKAIDERGEDSGVLFTKAEDRYVKALSDAVTLDSRNLPHETIWEVQ